MAARTPRSLEKCSLQCPYLYFEYSNTSKMLHCDHMLLCVKIKHYLEFVVEFKKCIHLPCEGNGAILALRPAESCNEVGLLTDQQLGHGQESIAYKPLHLTCNHLLQRKIEYVSKQLHLFHEKHRCEENTSNQKAMTIQTP
jgi:hypothetical protein